MPIRVTGILLLTFTLVGLWVWKTHPAFAGSKSKAIVLRTSSIFDSENGRLVSFGNIVVEDGVITSVGSSNIPSDATVYDLSKYTILPGLIDVHTHLMLLDRSGGKDAAGETLRNVKIGTPLRVLEAVPRAADFLLHGITTVRDLGNSGDFGDLSLQAAIANGSIVGPRVFGSGKGLSPANGQLPEGTDPQIVNQEYRVISGTEDARAAVRENIERGVNAIKVYSDNAPNGQSLTLEELSAVVDEAHAHRLKVAAHAVKDTSIRNAIAAGVDSIEHAYEISDETLKVMAQKNIVMVPTDPDRETLLRLVEQSYPKDPKNPERVTRYMQPLADRLRRAVKAGVKIASGSDMYIDLTSIGFSAGAGARNVIYSYVDNGLTPSFALQAATHNAAELLGFKNRLGIILPDAYADIIAVEGDPTKDIKSLNRVVFVMKNGQVFLKP